MTSAITTAVHPADGLDKKEIQSVWANTPKIIDSAAAMYVRYPISKFIRLSPVTGDVKVIPLYLGLLFLS
jgi:hypothetical protein